MTLVRQEFEEWWRMKESLLPNQLKEMFWLAFADGWSRRHKSGD